MTWPDLWTGAWQIDGTLDGAPLETEGWTYAVDFPAAYSAHKRFTSCVRRRRWVRYRRYVAVSAWSAVPPLHGVRTATPPSISPGMRRGGWRSAGIALLYTHNARASCLLSVSSAGLS